MKNDHGDWVLEYTFQPETAFFEYVTAQNKWFTMRRYDEEEHGLRALRRMLHVSVNTSKIYRLRNEKSGETTEEPAPET